MDRWEAKERAEELIAGGDLGGALELMSRVDDYIPLDYDPLHELLSYSIEIYDDGVKSLHVIDVDNRVYFIDFIDSGIAVYTDFREFIENHLEYLFPDIFEEE